MDATSSKPACALPSDLIDIIISNLVRHKNPIAGAKLTRLERRDLASCGLVCRPFYLPSRRYLFSTLTINLDLHNSDGSEIRLSRNGLVDILTGSPPLQDQIRHLVVTYMVNKSSPSIWAGVSGNAPGDDHLQAIVPRLPALRKLTLSSSLPGRLSFYNHAVVSVLHQLTTICPHFRSLALCEIYRVPHDFIHYWANISELKLHRTFFDRLGSFNHTIGERLALGQIRIMIDKPNLEKLYLSGGMYFPERLRYSLNPRRLRFLQIAIDTRATNLAVSDVVHLVHRISPELRHLSLKNASSEPWLEMFSNNVLQNLTVLDITENTRMHVDLPNIARFLTPEGSDVVSSIERIFISISGDSDDMIEMFDHNFGWLELDELWASPQYQRLMEVNIRLVFTAAQTNRTFLLLKNNTNKLLRRIENSSTRLLPLVTGTPRISFHFYVKISALSRYISWSNLTGKAANFSL